MFCKVLIHTGLTVATGGFWLVVLVIYKLVK